MRVHDSVGESTAPAVAMSAAETIEESPVGH